MRWFITLNGEECSDPAPIEAVIFSSNARTANIHRGATIAGELYNASDHTTSHDWSIVIYAQVFAVPPLEALYLQKLYKCS